MHISDTALECSRRCAQLALKCTNEEIAVEHNILQLMAAAVRCIHKHSLGAGSPRDGPVSSDPPDLIHSRPSGLVGYEYSTAGDPL